ncbi:CidA/LrgA family protein [Parendozoicomonas sp. Alg238-R29]|uniref:CidA/LrgA family protein n=1 Tax=Parendozoicomonas sp. Alg238-R29 TaxID=2993446 RepID=UPI00248D82D6|nr:CidA/LrgA family protein [Parendozoicomonas sp. Alg238-R29]
MRGLFILLFFQVLGEAGSSLLGLPLPGPVLGMLLLFGTLCVVKIVPDDLQSYADTLIASLGMLLIPAATGFGYYLVKIQGQILPIAVAASVGTVIAIVFTGLLMNKLIREEREGHDD